MVLTAQLCWEAYCKSIKTFKVKVGESSGRYLVPKPEWPGWDFTAEWLSVGHERTQAFPKAFHAFICLAARDIHSAADHGHQLTSQDWAALEHTQAFRHLQQTLGCTHPDQAPAAVPVAPAAPALEHTPAIAKRARPPARAAPVDEPVSSPTEEFPSGARWAQHIASLKPSCIAVQQQVLEYWVRRMRHRKASGWKSLDSVDPAPTRADRQAGLARLMYHKDPVSNVFQLPPTSPTVPGQRRLDGGLSPQAARNSDGAARQGVKRPRDAENLGQHKSQEARAAAQPTSPAAAPVQQAVAAGQQQQQPQQQHNPAGPTVGQTLKRVLAKRSSHVVISGGATGAAAAARAAAGLPSPARGAVSPRPGPSPGAARISGAMVVHHHARAGGLALARSPHAAQRPLSSLSMFRSKRFKGSPSEPAAHVRVSRKPVRRRRFREESSASSGSSSEEENPSDNDSCEESRSDEDGQESDGVVSSSPSTSATTPAQRGRAGRAGLAAPAAPAAAAAAAQIKTSPGTLPAQPVGVTVGSPASRAAPAGRSSPAAGSHQSPHQVSRGAAGREHGAGDVDAAAADAAGGGGVGSSGEVFAAPEGRPVQASVMSPASGSRPAAAPATSQVVSAASPAAAAGGSRPTAASPARQGQAAASGGGGSPGRAVGTAQGPPRSPGTAVGTAVGQPKRPSGSLFGLRGRGQPVGGLAASSMAPSRGGGDAAQASGAEAVQEQQQQGPSNRELGRNARSPDVRRGAAVASPAAAVASRAAGAASPAAAVASRAAGAASPAAAVASRAAGAASPAAAVASRAAGAASPAAAAGAASPAATSPATHRSPIPHRQQQQQQQQPGSPGLIALRNALQTATEQPGDVESVRQALQAAMLMTEQQTRSGTKDDRRGDRALWAQISSLIQQLQAQQRRIAAQGQQPTSGADLQAQQRCIAAQGQQPTSGAGADAGQGANATVQPPASAAVAPATAAGAPASPAHPSAPIPAADDPAAARNGAQQAVHPARAAPQTAAAGSPRDVSSRDKGTAGTGKPQAPAPAAAAASALPRRPPGSGPTGLGLPLGRTSSQQTSQKLTDACVHLACDEQPQLITQQQRLQASSKPSTHPTAKVIRSIHDQATTAPALDGPAAAAMRRSAGLGSPTANTSKRPAPVPAAAGARAGLAQPPPAPAGALKLPAAPASILPPGMASRLRSGRGGGGRGGGAGTGGPASRAAQLARTMEFAAQPPEFQDTINKFLSSPTPNAKPSKAAAPSGAAAASKAKQPMAGRGDGHGDGNGNENAWAGAADGDNRVEFVDLFDVDSEGMEEEAAREQEEEEAGDAAARELVNGGGGGGGGEAAESDCELVTSNLAPDGTVVAVPRGAARAVGRTSRERAEQGSGSGSDAEADADGAGLAAAAGAAAPPQGADADGDDQQQQQQQQEQPRRSKRKLNKATDALPGGGPLKKLRGRQQHRQDKDTSPDGQGDVDDRAAEAGVSAAAEAGASAAAEAGVSAAAEADTVATVAGGQAGDGDEATAAGGGVEHDINPSLTSSCPHNPTPLTQSLQAQEEQQGMDGGMQEAAAAAGDVAVAADAGPGADVAAAAEPGDGDSRDVQSLNTGPGPSSSSAAGEVGGAAGAPADERLNDESDNSARVGTGSSAQQEDGGDAAAAGPSGSSANGGDAVRGDDAAALRPEGWVEPADLLAAISFRGVGLASTWHAPNKQPELGLVAGEGVQGTTGEATTSTAPTKPGQVAAAEVPVEQGTALGQEEEFVLPGMAACQAEAEQPGGGELADEDLWGLGTLDFQTQLH